MYSADDESLQRILLLGADDWISMDEVIWACTGGVKDNAGREQVERVLRRMYEEGLFVPGELEDAGFVDWPGTPVDWVWSTMSLLQKHNWWFQGTGPWIRITDKGERLVVQ